MPKPWEVLSTRYVVDNEPWNRTRLDRCRLADGTEIDYYTQEYPDWVNAVVLTPTRDLVLVRQYRHGIRDMVLEIPGGVVDPGEDARDAAVREVAEETGYRTDRAPVLLGRYRPNPATSNNWVSSYLLVDARPVGAPEPDSTEDLEHVVMPFSAFLARVAAGDVPHIFSALAVLMAARRLTALEA